MEVQLSALEGPEIDAWTLLFHLHTAYPDGWMVVGAQMVIVHAARYEISRPVRTGDTDVLVDIRSVDIREVAQWLLREGFELEGVSAEGIGHRFFRGEVKIDLLSIDHLFVSWATRFRSPSVGLLCARIAPATIDRKSSVPWPNRTASPERTAMVSHSYRSQTGTRVVRLHSWKEGPLANIRKVTRKEQRCAS